MQIRVRGPNGAAVVSLEVTATWLDLKREITEKTGVPDYDIKLGYPPQTLNTESIDNDVKLSDLSFKLDKEQLTIVPRDMQSSLTNPISSAGMTSIPTLPPRSIQSELPSKDIDDEESNNDLLRLTSKPKGDIESDPPEVPVPQLDGVLVLRVMPDDNSCLFRALSTAILGSSLDGMTELRSIVAQTIQENSELYDVAVLEKTPEAYCKWIQREDSWGGGIELSILSQHFDIEICSINVQDTSVLRFNEGRPSRCILVYSGIHYDVCAVTPFASADPEFDRKVFDVVRIAGDGEDGGVVEMDGGALEAAVQLCQVLQSRHYYTDTHSFEVRCSVCGQSGKGEQWASEHASLTGHMDYGEN